MSYGMPDAMLSGKPQIMSYVRHAWLAVTARCRVCRTACRMSYVVYYIHWLTVYICQVSTVCMLQRTKLIDRRESENILKFSNYLVLSSWFMQVDNCLCTKSVLKIITKCIQVQCNQTIVFRCWVGLLRCCIYNYKFMRIEPSFNLHIARLLSRLL